MKIAEIVKMSTNGVCMKILVVFLHGNIFEPKAGREVRIHNLAKQLAKENEIVTLESKEYRETNVSFPVRARYFVNPFAIKKIHFGTFFADLNPSYILSLIKVLRNEKPRIIQVSFPYGVFVTKILSKIMIKNCIVIYDAHNVESNAHRDVVLKNPYTSFLKKWIDFIYTYIAEKLACRFADHIITVSKEDADCFIRYFSVKREKISVIPTGTSIIDLQTYDRMGCREKLGLKKDSIVVVFHGNYTYYPNMEAIKLITDYIAPEIHKKFKNVLFVVAGKDAPKFEKDGIKFLGFVDNIYELLAASDMAIVPILRGGGTRVKIMDYLNVGLPIVTTKKGIEGIEAENGKHAIIVDDVNEEFIKALEFLIENDSERRKLGRNARKLAEEGYDWTKIGEKLNKLYKHLAEGD
jgi:glycosyltransferase involved in cell wall biosynthesis